MAKKMHTKAPLPFIEQKRAFLARFAEVLHQAVPGDGDGWTILDAFGGSGLLSHAAKHHKPAARVIYNDYDDYATRLRHIPDINRLRRTLEDVLRHHPRGVHLKAAKRAEVMATIRAFDGHVDLPCLISWLLFSGNQAANLDAFAKMHLYHTLRQSDYPDPGGYLDGLDITREHYADLLLRHANNPRCLFVLDPPYVRTAQEAYKQRDYFGMVQFLRLMQHVRPPFIFFSSTRSELPDYLQLVIGDRLPGWERFAGYQTISVKTTLNQTAQYEDNLIYKC